LNSHHDAAAYNHKDGLAQLGCGRDTADGDKEVGKDDGKDAGKYAPASCEVLVHTWVDATLAELAGHLRATKASGCPGGVAASRPGARLSFALVYPDRTGEWTPGSSGWDMLQRMQPRHIATVTRLRLPRRQVPGTRGGQRGRRSRGRRLASIPRFVPLPGWRLPRRGH